MENKYQLAILIGSLFNQGIAAKEAWSVPGKLAQRYYNIHQTEMTLENMYILSQNEINQLITQDKSLHRFPNKMTKDLYYNIHLIQNNFGGIEQFFRANETELLERFISLRGIGMHKAIQAIILYSAIEEDFKISNDTLIKAEADCSGFIENIERDKNLILKILD